MADLDLPNLADIASQFDVILHLAHSDHSVGATEIIKGLEKRAETSARDRKPILIHTSGSGVLIDSKETPEKSNPKQSTATAIYARTVH
jgi:hypothetical protein